MDRAIFWVGEYHFSYDPVEGVAKLHGTLWKQVDGVFVDARERVVTDPSRTSFALGDHAGWAKVKVR